MSVPAARPEGGSTIPPVGASPSLTTHAKPMWPLSCRLMPRVPATRCMITGGGCSVCSILNSFGGPELTRTQ
jgi:hypothetical protein